MDSNLISMHTYTPWTMPVSKKIIDLESWNKLISSVFLLWTQLKSYLRRNRDRGRCWNLIWNQEADKRWLGSGIGENQWLQIWENHIAQAHVNGEHQKDSLNYCPKLENRIVISPRRRASTGLETHLAVFNEIKCLNTQWPINPASESCRTRGHSCPAMALPGSTFHMGNVNVHYIWNDMSFTYARSTNTC